MIHFWRSLHGICSEFSAFVAEVVEKCFDFFIVFGVTLRVWIKNGVAQAAFQLPFYPRPWTHRQQNAVDTPFNRSFPQQKWLEHSRFSSIYQSAHKIETISTKTLDRHSFLCYNHKLHQYLYTVTHFHAVIIPAKSGGVKYENEVSKTIPKMGGLKT